MERTEFEIAQDKFEQSHASIVRSCNYILIFNGVLIAAIITAFWNWSTGDINDHMLLNCYNCTALDTTTRILEQLGRKVNFLLILFPCFCSLACSLGVFNSGIYPKCGEYRPSIRDFEKREIEAFRWYTAVCTFIGIAVLSVFIYIFSLLFPGLTIPVAIILYILFFSLLYFEDLFSHFGYSRKESLIKDIKGFLNFLSQERVYELLIIISVIILNFVMMRLYP